VAQLPPELLEELLEAIRALDPEKVEEAAARLLGELESVAPGEPAELVTLVEQAAAAGDAGRLRQLTKEFTQQLRATPEVYPKVFTAALAEAASSFEHDRVKELCDALTAHLRVRGEPYPLGAAKSILGELRRKRYFEHMKRVAEALLQAGQSDARVRRQYGQALLDSGQLVAGLELLSALESDCEKAGDEGELAEARGLIGRAYKQMYVDAANAGGPVTVVGQHLLDAVDAYWRVYRKDDANLWHGINTVACVRRAEVDGLALGERSIYSRKLAHEVYDGAKNAVSAKEADDKEEVSPTVMPYPWDLPTAAEACVAEGDFEKALKWVVRYTDPELDYADAFEIGSTLRQLEEVWRLDSSDPEQAKVLQLLRAALLQREGGSVQVDNLKTEAAAAANLAQDTKLEAVLGKERYRTLRWYATGVERASGVAQILNPSGAGHGTGFLLRGADVHSSIADEWVLVTNAHVISSDPNEQAGEPPALDPEEATVTFEAGGAADEEVGIGRLLFSSGRRDLDCTIATLDGKVSFDKPPRISKGLPKLDSGQRVYVIGHPRGLGLRFSFDDNLLLDYEVPRVHYRAPTEGGSSGSPVFNEAWGLIALHHAGGMAMKKLNNQPGTYPANEGLAMSSILAAVARELD
jgi:tetratricopeptide (TPR) repeat protein